MLLDDDFSAANQGVEVFLRPLEIRLTPFGCVNAGKPYPELLVFRVDHGNCVTVCNPDYVAPQRGGARQVPHKQQANDADSAHEPLRAAHGCEITSRSCPLDLIPEVPNNIPADKIPPFFLATYKTGDLSALTLSADIRGIVPIGSLVSAAGVGSLAGGGYTVYVAASIPNSGSSVYYQLDSDNYWSVLT